MRDLPKVELHLHLEGGAPPAFIRGLAQEKRMDISGIFTEDGGYAYRDFNHFLQVYEAACSVLTGPEEFGRLTRAVLEECAAHGVIYTEVFLSPDFCGGADPEAWRDYLAAIRQAAEAVPDITMRGIVTCVRHFGPDQAKKAAECAADTAGDFVVGFGMGGAEDAHSPADFKWAFDCAREAGLHITTHAGEWGGAKSVRDSIEALTPSRIGHGVQSIDDPALCDLLVERDITLEVCPGSNVFLGVVPSLDQHPIERLRARGVKVTVSTDDPPFFRTTMTKEYEDLARTFGYDDAVFAELNANAVDAAYCDAATKDMIRKKLTPQKG
ncbi:adenosine deaminase [Jannaschia sp. CCS1]|uniref:adenosine deaminase n=1 Tax=Jannaschia sp. (strain CCS1) TaxID=290400 RepID=UPI000053A9CD|nr:adenosine deaminase [Jannaschia sp. CCS1]ABD55901.1 adenosine deaminase [Jannaschia sp. CCS1]